MKQLRIVLWCNGCDPFVHIKILLIIRHIILFEVNFTIGNELFLRSNLGLQTKKIGHRIGS
jgi:hypothetical protein